MKIFLDSVDINEIKNYQSYGIIDGVTTNPSLMASAEGGFYDVATKIASVVDGDVSIEVSSNEYESMVEEGKKILEIGSNVVIKLPTTWDGIKACKFFSGGGHKVNMTLCFSPTQALLAAKAGACYVSPFIGRLDDIGENGMQLIADIRDIYDNYEFKTEILAASIRTCEHVADSAIYGADVATMTGKVLSKLIHHELTDKGLEKFNADWKKSGMKI